MSKSYPTAYRRSSPYGPPRRGSQPAEGGSPFGLGPLTSLAIGDFEGLLGQAIAKTVYGRARVPSIGRLLRGGAAAVRLAGPGNPLAGLARALMDRTREVGELGGLAPLTGQMLGTVPAGWQPYMCSSGPRIGYIRGTGGPCGQLVFPHLQPPAQPTFYGYVMPTGTYFGGNPTLEYGIAGPNFIRTSGSEVPRFGPVTMPTSGPGMDGRASMADPMSTRPGTGIRSAPTSIPVSLLPMLRDMQRAGSGDPSETSTSGYSDLGSDYSQAPTPPGPPYYGNRPEDGPSMELVLDEGVAIGIRPSPPHQRRPDRAREKSRKAVWNVPRTWLAVKALDMVLEGIDVLEAVWKALDKKTKGRLFWERIRETGSPLLTPQRMAQEIWENADKIDISQALVNLGLNEVEDRVIGAFSRHLVQPANQVMGRPVGVETGAHDFGSPIPPGLLDWLGAQIRQYLP